MTVSGKESTFTVEAPDYIKNIRLKINLKSQKITEMHLLSNLGVQGDFVYDNLSLNNKELTNFGFAEVTKLTTDKEGYRMKQEQVKSALQNIGVREEV